MRDLAIELRIVGRVDLAHAAAPHEPEHDEAIDRLTALEDHAGGRRLSSGEAPWEGRRPPWPTTPPSVHRRLGPWRLRPLGRDRVSPDRPPADRIGSPRALPRRVSDGTLPFVRRRSGQNHLHHHEPGAIGRRRRPGPGGDGLPRQGPRHLGALRGHVRPGRARARLERHQPRVPPRRTASSASRTPTTTRPGCGSGCRATSSSTWTSTSRSAAGDIKLELYGDGESFDHDRGAYTSTGYVLDLRRLAQQPVGDLPHPRARRRPQGRARRRRASSRAARITGR